IVARDPVTGIDTTGFHRLMLRGKNRLGVSLHSRRRLYEFHRRAEERGQALPAAVALGTHPLHYMGSMVYAYPPHVRKFEIIGGDRKSTRLNSSHLVISYAVFCLKKKKKKNIKSQQD